MPMKRQFIGPILTPTFNTDDPDAYVVFNNYGDLGEGIGPVVSPTCSAGCRRIDFSVDDMWVNHDDVRGIRSGHLITRPPRTPPTSPASTSPSPTTPPSTGMRPPPPKGPAMLPENVFDAEALIRICQMREGSFAKAYGMTTVEVDQPAPANYYHFKDNGSDILAVAHLDTVAGRKARTARIVDTEAGPVIHSRALDDRLGAYVILDMLPKLGLTFDWLLTTGEESGMSTAAFFDAPKKYRWIIEFDRGGTDVVMYHYEDPEVCNGSVPAVRRSAGVVLGHLLPRPSRGEGVQLGRRLSGLSRSPGSRLLGGHLRDGGQVPHLPCRLRRRDHASRRRAFDEGTRVGMAVPRRRLGGVPSQSSDSKWDKWNEWDDDEPDFVEYPSARSGDQVPRRRRALGSPQPVTPLAGCGVAAAPATSDSQHCESAYQRRKGTLP